MRTSIVGGFDGIALPPTADSLVPPYAQQITAGHNQFVADERP
jgi:hypothetical protein